MWTDEVVAQLKEKVKNVKGEIPYATCETIAEEFQCSVRSITGKLRSLGYSVGKKAVEKTKSYTEQEERVIAQMVQQGAFIEDIAKKMGREVKQIRGKLLSMKLKAPTRDKKEARKKSYTPEQEQQIQKLVEQGAFVEDIAQALNKTVPQIRGKLLSMRLKAPTKNKKEKSSNKIYTEELITKIGEMFKAGKTEEQIADELSLKKGGVHKKLIELGLATKKEKTVFWTDERVDELTNLFNNTSDTIDIIANKIGTSMPIVAKKLGQLGLDYSSRKAKKQNTNE